MENLKIISDEIQKAIDNWNIIICSISSAKRNGKVTQRVTWVRRDNPEKCINSFVDKHGEKLTNYVLGKVDMHTLPSKNKNTPNHVRLMEWVEKSVGEVKYFKPVMNEEGYWVYKLDENLSGNVYLKR